MDLGRTTRAQGNGSEWGRMRHGEGLGSSVISFLPVLVPVRASKRKKENGQPKGGMGGRHAATTQGF